MEFDIIRTTNWRTVQTIDADTRESALAIYLEQHPDVNIATFCAYQVRFENQENVK